MFVKPARAHAAMLPAKSLGRETVALGGVTLTVAATAAHLTRTVRLFGNES